MTSRDFSRANLVSAKERREAYERRKRKKKKKKFQKTCSCSMLKCSLLTFFAVKKLFVLSYACLFLNFFSKKIFFKFFF